MFRESAVPSPHRSPGAAPPWDPLANPAMTDLLNHIAEELAREYVSLMKAAADGGTTDPNGEQKKSEEARCALPSMPATARRTSGRRASKTRSQPAAG